MKINVLIFPAGEINSVELHDALSHNVNINVFGASSIDRHGSYVFKNYRCDIPMISHKDFIYKFNEMIDEWGIDCIFPTHDTVALFLIENQQRIHAKVISADVNTARICRDKRKTYHVFKDEWFVPKIYSDFSVKPCFLKPCEGQGSVGTKLINSEKDVPENIDLKDYLICEYLPGEEVTVDCVTDMHGKLKAVLPRLRQRILAGVCTAGKALECSEQIDMIAQCINQKLNFMGLWYFQIKKDINDKWKLLEISTRCAGTMCLSRARGVNLPLLSVYTAMDRDISIFDNPYTVRVDRTFISRYRLDYIYDTVYIDYDDTIIENDMVCLPVIRFLYQCKNKNIKVVLISRHETYCSDSLEESMYKHAISLQLFDQIIRLKPEEEKSFYIDAGHAIFIDNSYKERKMVYDKLRIPVFDVEGIEVITDWCE